MMEIKGMAITTERNTSKDPLLGVRTTSICVAPGRDINPLDSVSVDENGCLKIAEQGDVVFGIAPLSAVIANGEMQVPPSWLKDTFNIYAW